MHTRWLKPMVCGMALALGAAAAGHALAQSSEASAPKTRDQVKSELIEAQRTGNIVPLGSATSKRLNELYPERYPNPSAGQALSREEVKAELREAQRTGNIVALSDSGKMLKELYPNRYRAR